MSVKQKPPERIWDNFRRDEKLTQEQTNMFERYAEFLLQTNQDYNLTAIKDLAGVVRQHFQDSFALRNAIDLNTITTIADVGTGAGFPAIPLKILYPHLKVKLIEVTKKKQQFLAQVIEMFGLEDVEIVDCEWRTFLRNSQYDIDLFVTRAALDDMELIRMFQPSCRYKNATLVYWAADTWVPNKKSVPFVQKKVSYKLARRERFLAFMKLPVATGL